MLQSLVGYFYSCSPYVPMIFGIVLFPTRAFKPPNKITWLVILYLSIVLDPSNLPSLGTYTPTIVEFPRVSFSLTIVFLSNTYLLVILYGFFPFIVYKQLDPFTDSFILPNPDVEHLIVYGFSNSFIFVSVIAAEAIFISFNILDNSNSSCAIPRTFHVAIFICAL